MRGRNFCFLSLFILLALAVEPPAKGYTDGKPLRFDLYHGYLIVVQGSAGSQKGLNFLLDTGANPTVLDRRLARKLHLQEAPGVLTGINGRMQAGLTTVPGLQIGPVRRENFGVIVEDLSFFSKAIPVRIDGVIGLDVLGQSPLEIDYTEDRIVFGSVPSLKNSLPLQLRGELPTVSAEVDHLSAHLVLDTGASSLILFAPKGPASITRVKANEIQKSTSMMGEFERKPVQLGSVTLGQVEFRHQQAFLVQRRWDGTIDFDGLMNPAMLGITKVVIDVQRGVLEWSR